MNKGYTYSRARDPAKLAQRQWVLDDSSLGDSKPAPEPRNQVNFEANPEEAVALSNFLKGALLVQDDDDDDFSTDCTTTTLHAEKKNISHSGQGSQTARVVNEGRYGAYLLGFGQDNLSEIGVLHEGLLEDKVEPDFLQRHGCTPGVFKVGGLEAARALLKENPWMVYDKHAFMAVRTSWIDDVLETFAIDHAGKSPNFVILGGGWDFRLFRLPLQHLAGGGKLYEVDAVGTQSRKLAAIENAIQSGSYEEITVESRDAITYVTCDFETESWFDRLQKAGLDNANPTVVIMEGITYYITEQAVRANLEIISQRFPKTEALIAFDYPGPEMHKLMQEHMSKLGEPWLFKATPEEMEKIVRESQLQVLENLSIADLFEVYVPSRKSDNLPVSVGSSLKKMLVAGNDNAANATK